MLSAELQAEIQGAAAQASVRPAAAAGPSPVASPPRELEGRFGRYQIQKKIGKNTDTDVTSLLGLVDELADFLKRRPLAAAPWAVWVRTDNEPLYAPDHLAEKRMFTSVLTVTYRVLK